MNSRAYPPPPTTMSRLLWTDYASLFLRKSYKIGKKSWFFRYNSYFNEILCVKIILKQTNIFIRLLWSFWCADFIYLFCYFRAIAKKRSKIALFTKIFHKKSYNSTGNRFFGGKLNSGYLMMSKNINSRTNLLYFKRAWNPLGGLRVLIFFY